MAYYIDEEHSDIIFEVNGEKVSLKVSNSGGGSSGGSNVYLITVGDTSIPTDRNTFSALRVLAEIQNASLSLGSNYLRKDMDDIDPYLLKFLQGIQLGRNYIEGLTGTGGRIYGDGSAELKSLRLREFLEVPELRFNRVEVIVGDKWRAPGGGIIESVTVDKDTAGNPLNTGTVTLHLEEGEIGAVSIGDICMGIFHDFKNTNNNETSDGDDGIGNRKFAGFCTVYFTIQSVSSVNGGYNNQFTYSLRPSTNGYYNPTAVESLKVKGGSHPCSQMHFVTYGHWTDKNRQTSVYETRTYTRMLVGQNTWEISLSNVGLQYGDFSSLEAIAGAPSAVDMENYSMYLGGSIFMRGTIQKVVNDVKIEDVNDMGAWESGRHYPYRAQVDHDGSIWLCVNEAGTNTEPVEGSPDWYSRVDKGKGIESKGHWNSLGTPYSVNTIVNFAGSAFIANKDTANPPYPLIKDFNGNYVKTSDNQYVIASYVRNADWDVLVDTNKLTAGADGDTPYIKNGHWWIGNTDTGVKAAGKDGQDATSPVVLDLNNDNDSILCDENGKLAPDIELPETTATLYDGNAAVTDTTLVLWSNTPENCVITTTAYADGKYKIRVTSVTDTAKVTIRAAYKGKVYSKVFNITKLMGVNRCWITLSDTVIRYNPDSKVYTPASITIRAYKLSNKQVSEITSEDDGYLIINDGTVRYQSGTTVNKNNVVSGKISVKLYAKNAKGTYTMVDHEDIPVLNDGAAGKDGKNSLPVKPWKSGTTYEYMRIVTMGGSVYQVINQQGTINPPLYCVQNFDGNYILNSDNGYILTGEVNTTDYTLVVSSPKDGRDAKETEWIYRQTAGERPPVPSSEQTDDYVPSGWTDDPMGVSEVMPYEWACLRTKENGIWGNFTPPALWAKFGTDGKDAVFADLDNEMESVALDTSGKTVAASDFTTKVSVYSGTNSVTLTNISCSLPTNITLKSYNLATGTVVFSVANGVVIGTSNKCKITVTGSYKGMTYTKTLDFAINGVKGGKDGKNAVLYRLVPSVGSVVKRKDGTYSVSSVSCSVKKIDGTSVSDATGGELRYSTDGGTEKAYTSPIATSAFSKSLTFAYYVGGTLMDKETIPLVQDGTDGKDGASFSAFGNWRSGVTVPANSMVTMGGKAFVSTRNTANPPIYCVQDFDGNYILNSDNGYILTGEVNTADYKLLVESGINGRGVKTVSEMYLATAAETVAKTDTGWTSSIPSTSMDKPYLYNYEITEYTDGTKFETEPHRIYNYAKDGKGIASIRNRYIAWSTDVLKDNPNWTDTMQSVSADKKYLWNYEIITYTDGTTSETDPRIILMYAADATMEYLVVSPNMLSTGYESDGTTRKWKKSNVLNAYAYKKTGKSVSTFSGYICVYIDGTLKYSVTAASLSYTVPIGYADSLIQVRLYKSSSQTDTVLDEKTVSVSNDGIAGIGTAGCAIRKSIYKKGVKYRNDSKLEDGNPSLENGVKYIDVAGIKNLSTGSWNFYMCNITHTSVGNTPEQDGYSASSPSTSKWTKFNDPQLYYTPLMLAEKISAEDIDVDSLTVDKLLTSKTGARIQVSGTLMRFFGNVAENMQFGLDDNGMFTMKYLDNNGNEMWKLDPTGFTATSAVGEAWNVLDASLNRVVDLEGASIGVDINGIISSGDYMSLIFKRNGTKPTNDKTLYRYQAGKVGNGNKVSYVAGTYGVSPEIAKANDGLAFYDQNAAVNTLTKADGIFIPKHAGTAPKSFVSDGIIPQDYLAHANAYVAAGKAVDFSNGMLVYRSRVSVYREGNRTTDVVTLYSSVIYG